MKESESLLRTAVAPLASKRRWQLGGLVLLVLMAVLLIFEEGEIHRGRGEAPTGLRSQQRRVHDARNLHATYPRRCGENGPPPPGFDASPPSMGGHHTHAANVLPAATAFKLQVCLYESLDIFRRLAKEHGITRWAAHAGSLIGSKCYSSMNPWDDDVDVTVSPEHTERTYRFIMRDLGQTQ